MVLDSQSPEITRVSRKGKATIPQELREKFGIETPGEVFVYEEEERIVIEPIPSIDDLHSIHAGDHESGEIVENARALLAEDERREGEKFDRLRPSEVE